MKNILKISAITTVLLFSGCNHSVENREEIEISRDVTETQAIKNVEIITKSTLVSVSAKKFKSFTDIVTKNDIKNVILDVRTLQEFQAGHIKNSIMLDFYKPDFTQKLSKLNKTKTYLIYCRSGNRTGQTLKIMKKLGFTSVYNLKYGINDWNRNGFKLVR